MFATRERRLHALSAIAAAFVLVVWFPLWCSARESIPQRLLRTIQIGLPQDITVEQIRRIADSDDTDYTTEMLARSALLVLHQDDPKLISFDELFDSLLSHMVSDGSPFTPIASLPNFRAKETVFTMVYAMVMSGNQDRAVNILEKHSLTGSRYKQGVVLSALRNIGTSRAVSVIQQYAEKGPGRNLAETTLADEDYPVLSEIHDRWNLVPPAQRMRDNLRTIVQGGCNQRAVLAAYWLGFFAPNIDPNKEIAEQQALENIARTNSPSCEMMEHVIAIKSLGLRAAKTVAYWKSLAERTPNVWERHQIIINAWGHWGRSFGPAALNLLATDPAQYVQWGLLNGNLETRQGREYRNYWDIWIPADILVVLQHDESQSRSAMDEKDLDAMLGWLDAGARPQDPVVLNHMIYHLAEFTSGDDTRRLLRVFNALAGRNQNWWILQTLRDPAALPILKYWSTLPAPPDQQQMLEHTTSALENRSGNPKAVLPACCEATEECLLEQVRHAPATSTNPGAAGSSTAPTTASEIRSEAEARKWLNDGATAEGNFTIRFSDELKRSAIVGRSDGTEERWQYLYDCWHRVDDRASAATH